MKASTRKRAKPQRPPSDSPTTPETPPPAPPGDAAQVPGMDRAAHVRFAAVSVLAGVLWFLGCPGIDLWFLAWVAMVPVLWVVDRVPTTRQAFLYAWLTGTVGNLGGFYWIAGMLTRFANAPGWVALVALVALAAYQGLIFAAFGAVTRVVRRATDLPAALVAPLAMVTFELVLPVIFPYHVAITQSWQVHVIQVADLAGPLGVTALLILVNGAIYDALTERRRRARSTAIAAGVFALALAYGHARIVQVNARREASPRIAVGVVQPNVAFDQKGDDRENFAERQLRDLQEQSARLERAGAELLLWPETSYPYAFGNNARRDFPEATRFRVRRGFTAPVVFGAIMRRRPDGGQSRFPYNAALMLDRDGNFTGRFDKRFLLVGGEYIPLRETFAFIDRIAPAAAGQYARGEGVSALPLRAADGREYRLGPMICYEDILPSFGRELAPLRPHLLVNITNDAWFGDTIEPWEHLGLSVFRAVEMRTDLVRAVNTGVSAFVDATGRVHARTYAVDPAITPRPADGLVARVALMEGGRTVYAAVGDVFGYACAASILFLWFGLPRLRRRARGGTTAG